LLQEIAGGAPVDFGVDAAQAWLPKGVALTDCLASREDAPVLLPRDVRLWSCTKPEPAVESAVPLYLHGPTAPPDVQIVWRAELDDLPLDAWKDWIEACPPLAAEAMPSPIGEARRWLAGAAVGDIADVRVRDQPEDLPRNFVFRVWRNGTLIDCDLRPGDTVVVPTVAGGADGWGWDPASTEPVVDRADEAMRSRGRRRTLRLSPCVLGFDPAWRVPQELSDSAVLQELRTDPSLSEEWQKLLDRERRPTVARDTGNRPIAVVVGATEATTEDDTSSLSSGKPRSLVEHAQGVEDFVTAFADRLGLPEALRHDLALAARLHDAGKAHPQFQRILYDGDVLAGGGVVLAKIGCRLGRGAWHRAGVPTGARHEVASLLIAMTDPDLARAHDPELVLWLIGTHHGHGRPLFPPVEWPVAHQSLIARWLALWEALNRQHGPWKLAHLEAVLRLADHRRSEFDEHEDA
jgi:CRISPR-associated endonuclease/helicase Cas3